MVVTTQYNIRVKYDAAKGAATDAAPYILKSSLPDDGFVVDNIYIANGNTGAEMSGASLVVCNENENTPIITLTKGMFIHNALVTGNKKLKGSRIFFGFSLGASGAAAATFITISADFSRITDDCK